MRSFEYLGWVKIKFPISIISWYSKSTYAMPCGLGFVSGISSTNSFKLMEYDTTNSGCLLQISRMALVNSICSSVDQSRNSFFRALQSVAWYLEIVGLP